MDGHDPIHERSVSLRAPSSEPSLHPRRDSTEDANETFTRKRPRLESGSRPVRSMSADRALSSSLHLGPAAERDFQMEAETEQVPGTPEQLEQTQHSSHTPSRITINIREPQSATVNGQVATEMDIGSPSTPTHLGKHPVSRSPTIEPITHREPEITTGLSSPPETESSSSSSPVEIEVSEPDDVDQDVAVHDITIDGIEEDMVATFLGSFPFSDEGGHLTAANLYFNHVDGHHEINLGSLDSLAKWLDSVYEFFKRRKYDWYELYYQQRVFWETVGKIFQKLLSRNDTCFGDGLRTDEVEPILTSLFRAHFLLVNRLTMVDVYMMKNPGSDDVIEMRPLSRRHLLAAGTLLTETKNQEEREYLPNVLADRYGFNISRIQTSVVQSFIEADGMRNLVQYVRAILDHYPKDDRNFGSSLNAGVTLAGALSKPIFKLFASGDSIPQSPKPIARHLLDLFKPVNDQLGSSIDKQQDPLNCDVRKTMVESLSHVVLYAVKLDPGVGKSILQDLIHHKEPSLTTNYPDMVPIVWKIKLMKRYISKGRMDLRIQGIDIMSSGLISFFQAHRNDDQMRGSLRLGTVAQVLEFVADVLLEEKITEYLVGVESHPQLITRGYNAVGFLAVTNKFSSEQADLVWQSIVSSQDPRVVEATLFLLEQLTKQLTKFDEDVYFCRKLLDSPLPTLSQRACSFFVSFLEVLRSEYKELSPEYHADEENDEGSLLPLKLCIRLMRDLSPTGPHGAAAIGIYGDALNTLRHLASLTSFRVRKSLYEMCIQSLRTQSDDAPADIQAILGMGEAKDCRDDFRFLAQGFSILPVLMDEFCSFVTRVNSSKQVVDDGRLYQALTPRLDLILKVVMLDSQTVSDDRTKVFWSHLVGSEAINMLARNVAWGKLAAFVPLDGSNNPFLDRCYDDFLSPAELQPAFFTPNFFLFVQNITRYKILKRQMVYPEDGDVVDIPGIDLLWRTILTAPPGTKEDIAMDFLANIYLDLSWPKHLSTASLEATHKSLVDGCLERLKSAHAELRHGTTTLESNEIGDSPGQKPRTASESEMMFVRTLLLLNKVLLSIRKLPQFRTRSDQSMQPSPEIRSVIRGPMVTIRCSFYKSGAGTATAKDIYIGEDDTCSQLHRRIARIASELDMSSYKIIWAGKFFSLLDKPRDILRDVGISAIANFMVREAQTQNDVQAARVTPSKQCQTAFETHIISNLHELYALMDSNDNISRAIFDFLNYFPPSEKIKSLVQIESVPLTEVFPRGQMCKIQYSFQCLTEVLQDKTETGPLDDSFILHSIHLVESFLTAGEDTKQVLPNDLPLAGVAIQCFFGFFAHRGSQDGSPFSNPELLVKRVCRIMNSALNYPDLMRLVWSCYEFLLAASLICPSAWQVFSQSYAESDREFQTLLDGLHYRLLLAQRQPHSRCEIRQMIKLSLERYSSSPHLTKDDLVSFYWNKISNLVTESPKYPYQCGEVFELAEYLLENYKDSLALSTQALQQYFSQWAILLADHDHIEIPGQDIIDQIARGFSSILRLCAQALAPNEIEVAFELVRTIWFKFLFPKLSNQSSEQVPGSLPILESTTRSSLIRLILTLSIDSELLFESFLKLAAGPKLDDRYRRGWTIDRSTILRSPSGYVGLRNLGNTCYMNSLLTQLFMNPGFRAFLLRCRTLASTSNLLDETQSLFARMQNSYQKAADASEFTCNITLQVGEKIDVREQMDVDEFMNSLFNQWEEQMLSNESRAEFLSYYQGKTVQQIKSRECDHISEREDTCLAIQCDVQGKATLQESLKAFIEGDVMQGDNKYKCEPCGKFVDAVKRTCLKQIPNHLILQLKRFEYDVGFQRRSKINDHFEFPMFIDMSQYTFEQLSDPSHPIAEDMFDLVGVIVHKGQADHGHYVSYIRARPTLPNQPPLWLQFDDQDVSTFQPRDIAEACYGGMPTTKETHFTTYSSGPKLHNAYMLFYQRQSTIDERTWPPTANNPQHVPIPDALEQVIADENASLLEGYCLFDQAHRDLVLALLAKLEQMGHEDGDHTVQKTITKIAWEYISSVWCRTKELPDFELAMAKINSVCSNCKKCCFLTIAWLASSPNDELRDFLLRSSQSKVRQHIRALILDALKFLREDESLYGADISEEAPRLNGNGASAIITTLAGYAPQDLGFNGRAWEEYFGLLSDIAALGNQECWLMIREGLLIVCIELFMYHWQPQLQSRYARVAELFRRRPVPPPQNQLIWLIARLFKHIDFDADAEYVNTERRLLSYDSDTGLIPLISEEYEMLMDFNHKEYGLVWLTELFDKWDATREGANDFAPGEIIRYLLRNTRTLATNVTTTIQSNIQCYEATFADPWMRATCIVVQHTRVKDIVREMTAFMAKTSKLVNPSNDSEGYNGASCLRFFQYLYQISASDLNEHIRDPAFFWRHYLAHIDSWAPHLLTFEKTYKIGMETYALLRESLFKDATPPEILDTGNVRSEKIRATAVRKLYRGCAARAGDVLQVETTKAAVYPIICAMRDCQEYLRLLGDIEGNLADQVKEDDDEELVSQFESFKQVFDTLPNTVADEDMSRSGELQNTEWEDLDLVDDGLEASELTDVEVSDDELAV